MDKRKVKQQQNIILHDLEDLENEAKKLKNPEVDLDRTFELLQERLLKKYEALKREAEGPAQSDLLREIDKLKRETGFSPDPNKLKQVHKRVSELKTEILFAPTPPRIDVNPLLDLIDNIGVESDSDKEDVAPFSAPLDAQLYVRDSPVDTLSSTHYSNRDSHTDQRRLPTPESSTLPLSSGERQRSSSSDRQRNVPSHCSDRQFDRVSESERAAVRHDDVESTSSRHVESENRSSFSNKRLEQKQPDLISPNTLLTPGAFTSSQQKPAAASRPPLAEQFAEYPVKPGPVFKLHSPTRRAPSPIGPRSPSPKHHRSSSPVFPVADSSTNSKQPYHYFNPQTNTIELQEITPDRKSQPRSEDATRRIMDDSRTPVRNDMTQPPFQSFQERTAEEKRSDITRVERSAIPREGHSATPKNISLKKGPKIIDMCCSPRIKRYFTEMTDFTTHDPTRPNFCTVEELYSPTQFFVKSLKVEETREKIQDELFNYVSTHGGSLRSCKSHTLGKMVLCRFSLDAQWYRACIMEILPEYRFTVLFVDYGNKETTSYDNLRDIPDDLIYSWPMCVQQCYLAGIETPDHADYWDQGTTEALWDLVSQKKLKIRVQQIESEVYGVILEIDDIININEKLVEMGLAVRKLDDSDQMKGLCTSPTYLAPVSQPPSATDRRNRSPSKQPDSRPPPFNSASVPESRPPRNFVPAPESRPPPFNPASVPESRPPRNFVPASESRPPPSNFISYPEGRAPKSRNTESRNVPESRSSQKPESRGGTNPKQYPSSDEDDEESPLVGRPPSFGNTVPPGPFSGEAIRSPTSGRGGESNVPAFGNSGPKGRGNIFEDVRGGARPPSSTGISSTPLLYRDNDQQDAIYGGIGSSHDIQDTGSQDNLDTGPHGDRWARSAYQDDLPPPNFTVSHKDLEDTAAVLQPSLDVLGQQIDRQTFDPNYQTPESRTKLKAKSPKASLRSSVDSQSDVGMIHSSRSDSPGPEDSNPPLSDQNRPSSSEIVVLGSQDPSQTTSDQFSPSSGVEVIDETTMSDGGEMDELETDDPLPDKSTDSEEETEPPITLTAALQNIIYDPKSYLLGNLTEEEAYSSYKKGEFTKLQIEPINPDSKYLAAMVTSVQSPELFCVTVLNNANIRVLNTLNESLNHLYSKKPVWQMGDKVTRKVGGEVWSGEVVTVNMNLLEIEWEGSSNRQWVNEDLVDTETSVSQMISNKLSEVPCKIEFSIGEFCAARYTWEACTPHEAVSWYRAMVLQVIRKKKAGKVIKYLVQFLDYGNVEEVDVKFIRPLPAKFQLLPAQAIPCFLPEIEPKEGGNDVTTSPADDVNVLDIDEDDDDTPYRGQYSPEAARAFVDLVFNERVYLSVGGEVVPLHYGYRADVQVSESDALLQFRNNSLPVTIADIADGIVVNLVTEYVKFGHADRIFNLDAGVYVPDPISSAAIEDRMKGVESTLAQLEEERGSTITMQSLGSELSSDIDSETLSTFDPMSEDYHSDNNLVDHDRDDVGQAVYGQKISQRTLCRFFSRGRRCYKGDKCKFLHQKKSDFHSIQSEQAMIAENKPPTPTNDMPIITQVTSVLTPFHFWAQILPHNINPGEIEMECDVKDPLTQLTEKMNSVYKFKGFRECKYYPAIGEIVAVKSRIGNEDFRRSRVTETDDVGFAMCKVFHLDFGTFEIVHEKALRVMDPNFIKELPFQAQEMLLADIRPSYSTSSEPVYVGTEEIRQNDEATVARDFFMERVTDKWLIAKVIERVPEGPLRVHLWDPSVGEDSRDWKSINRELVDRGFAESVHPLPEELTTDCGTLASSNYQDSD